MATDTMMPAADPLMPAETEPPLVSPDAIPQEAVQEELGFMEEQAPEETQVAGPVRNIFKAAKKEFFSDDAAPLPEAEPEDLSSMVRVEPGNMGSTLVIDTPRQEDVDSFKRLLGTRNTDLKEIIRPNLANKDLMDEVSKDYLTALYQTFDEKFGGVVEKKTIKELIADVQELGMDATLLELMKVKPGQAFNKKEVVQAEWVKFNLISTLRDASENGTTDELRNALALAGHLAPRIEAGIAEGAAGLAVRSHVARTTEMGGDLTQISEVLRRFDNSGIDDGDVEHIRILMNALPDAAKQTKFVSGILTGTNKGLNMISEAFISSILSGPVTHAVNMVANGAFMAYQVPERAMAGAIGKARTSIVNMTGWKGGIGVGRVKTNLFAGLSDADRAYATEALVMAQSTMRGVINGARAAGKAFKTEEAQFGRRGPGGAIEGASKVDTSQDKAISADYLGIPKVEGAELFTKDGALTALGRFVDYSGIAIRALGPRMLLVEDELAKGIAYTMEMEAQIYRKLERLRREGMDDDGLHLEARRMLAGLDDEVNDAATNYALSTTFQADLTGFQEKVGKLMAHPLVKPVNAFYKTPQWIVNEVAARSPLAIATPRFYRDMAAGGAKADLALSRAVMGSGLIMSLSYLASGEMMDGVRITGDYPEDPAMRDVWKRSKIMPYSVGIEQDDGEWFQISIDRFQPVSSLLAMAGDYAYFSQYGTEEDTVAYMAQAGIVVADDNLMMNTGKSVGNQLGAMPMMQGFSDIMEVLGEQYESYDQRIADAQKLLVKKYSGALLSAATPYSSALGTIERVTNPDASNVKPTDDQLGGRYYNSSASRAWMEALNRAKSRTPIIGSDAIPKLNMYGQVMKQCENGVWCGISPIRWDFSETTGAVRGEAAAVDSEMLKLGLAIRAPREGDPQRGVILSAEQYNEMIISLNAPMENRGANKNDELTFVGELYEMIGTEAYQDSEKGGKLNYLRSVMSERLGLVLDDMFEMVADPSGSGKKVVSDDASGVLSQHKRMLDAYREMSGKKLPQQGWQGSID
jgi:hypothetical protein